MVEKTLGYSYRICTTKILRAQFMRQKFYSGPIWLEQMRKFANPWHIARYHRVELGFKLLSVARGESLTALSSPKFEMTIAPISYDRRRRRSKK